MLSKTGAARTGFAALTLAAALATAAGPAAADIPLAPYSPGTTSDIAVEGAGSPGSSDTLLGPVSGSALGSASLSSTGSRNAGLLDLPMALGYVPCNPAKSSALGTLVAGLIEITGSVAYGVSCPPPTT
ncbi:hypothetical protein [Nocardia concava]|uniref:hypothetical protein n=1 Tax=Nocardia concava TaxID=257281 RepID=UPI0002E4ECD7|nr:hypothetical protein [Nocardia concava]